MLKVLFTLLILFSTSINADNDEITPSDENRLECNKIALEINDHQVELGFITKSKEVHLKTAELITLTTDKLIYAGEVANSIGDKKAVQEVVRQIKFHEKLFDTVEADYTKALNRETELTNEITALTMASTELNCPNESLSNDQILETCNAYSELNTNVNCMALKKIIKPEKKDEPKKAHPNTLEV